ncbi:MAG: hypothetical protein ABIJ09_22895 [Pseudomonadota bacterium]
MAGQDPALGLDAGGQCRCGGEGHDARLAELRHHVVICNLNPMVRAIVDELLDDPRQRVPAVVLLVQDMALWSEHPEWQPAPRHGDRVVVLGGCSLEERCFSRSGLARSQAALILADPRQGELADARSTLLAMAIERHSRDVHTVVELQWSVNRAHLEATEVDEVVCMGDLSEKLLAQCCITPGVKRIFERLLGGQGSSTRWQLPVLPGSCVGQSYRQVVQRSIAEGWPCVLCGFVPQPPEGEAPQFILNPRPREEPGKDSVLQARDRLIVMAQGEAQLPG